LNKLTDETHNIRSGQSDN